MFNTLAPLWLLSVIPLATAAPASIQPRLGVPDPTVVINEPTATLIGSSGATLGVIAGTVESFNAIPFAQPPVGQLRLKPPVRITDPMGTLKVQNSSAPSCPQFFLGSNLSIAGLPPSVIDAVLSASPFNAVGNGQEDCLTIDVQRPAGTKADAKLPVMLWIFGGGFELGNTAQYSGSSVVSNSMDAGKPFIFAAMNYRVGAWGFMPGKEILADGSANIGLLDQRMAMEWVADNIAQFGGDPDKVVIWGESAGAISVFDQMILNSGDITYNGKPLFRGAIMDSGSAIPANPVDTAKGQAVYDAVVQNTGCAGQADTLACLRSVNESVFSQAANAVPGILSFNSVALSYLPRPDGKVLTASPEEILSPGSKVKIPDIPFILGDQEDEGTLFALFQSNLTTTEDVQAYLKIFFFFDASDEQIKGLLDTYPEDPAAGSPFGTGDSNNWYPQYKRLAAILGDATFTLTRRAVLQIYQQVVPTARTWSYLSTYSKAPIMGTFHGTDLIQVFYGLPNNNASKNVRQYYMNFLYNLDPNDQSGGTTPQVNWQVPNWPMWKDGNLLMNITADNLALIPDNFRNESFEFLLNNQKAFHI